MPIATGILKRYRLKTDLQTLFQNLASKTTFETTGVLVNTLGKSVDPETHGAALKALDALEKAGLLEVELQEVRYLEK